MVNYIDFLCGLGYNDVGESISALISVIITDNKLITETRIGDMVRIPQRHRATLCSRYHKNYANSVKLKRVGITLRVQKIKALQGF